VFGGDLRSSALPGRAVALRGWSDGAKRRQRVAGEEESVITNTRAPHNLSSVVPECISYLLGVLLVLLPTP
jgi:hypothetical protein